MRAPKAREERPGLFFRLLRVVWVVSLTGASLVGGVYWIGKSHCPDPCRIDGQHGERTQAQAPQPQVPQAVYSKPKAIR